MARIEINVITGSVESLPDIPPPPPDPEPPISCTPWQFRKALNATGLRASLDSYMATASQDEKDGYEFANEFRSDDPVVLSAASAIGKTAEDAYQFIQFARTL